MSFVPPRYASAGRYPVRRPTFIPKAPGPAGAGSGGGGIAGLIGGLACPLLCLGCLSTIAILGLFATMIGAAAYMNGVQQQLRKLIQGAGTTIEINMFVLMCALLCSIYVLAKHRRGAAISN